MRSRNFSDEDMKKARAREIIVPCQSFTIQIVCNPISTTRRLPITHSSLSCRVQSPLPPLFRGRRPFHAFHRPTKAAPPAISLDSRFCLYKRVFSKHQPRTRCRTDVTRTAHKHTSPSTKQQKDILHHVARAIHPALDQPTNQSRQLGRRRRRRSIRRRSGEQHDEQCLWRRIQHHRRQSGGHFETGALSLRRLRRQSHLESQRSDPMQRVWIPCFVQGEDESVS